MPHGCSSNQHAPIPMERLIVDEKRHDENRQEHGVEDRSRAPGDDQPAGMSKGGSAVGQERGELLDHENHQGGRREKSRNSPAPCRSKLASAENGPVALSILR